MEITPEDLLKFNELLKTIKVSITDFDEFLSLNPHIYRSIRGHAFEVWFDRKMKERGVPITSVGGDNVVDRVINGNTLQLKTTYLNATIPEVTVAYRMHKTHGAEIKPHCYYKKDEFADYLVGAHPTKGVIICPRKYLPTRGEVNVEPDYPEYLADPMPFEWDTKWLNRYDLLGLNMTDYPTIIEHSKFETKYFPKLIAKIGFTDFDIIQAILDEKNFRIWYQLIVGTIREFHFAKIAKEQGINLNQPKNLSTRENQKVDYLLDSGTRIQVKGLTKGMSSDLILGCETQGSHGRVPNRLYQRTDFDFLAIVIDPNTIPAKVAAKLGIITEDYNFVIVPISKLPRHPRSDEWQGEFIKSQFLFKPEEVEYNQFELLK